MTTGQREARDTQKRNRPVGVNILGVLTLCTALWNSLRLGEAIFFWKTLAEYGAPPLLPENTTTNFAIIPGMFSWGPLSRYSVWD
jgi:hypothetical protein